MIGAQRLLVKSVSFQLYELQVTGAYGPAFELGAYARGTVVVVMYFAEMIYDLASFDDLVVCSPLERTALSCIGHVFGAST